MKESRKPQIFARTRKIGLRSWAWVVTDGITIYARGNAKTMHQAREKAREKIGEINSRYAVKKDQ